MKKNIWLGVLFVLSLGIIGGCGKSSSEGSDSLVSGELRIWEHSANFEQPLEDLVTAFNEKYPDVEIETEYKGTDYYSVLTTAIQSGSGPDLFWTNGTATENMKNFVDQGVIDPLPSSVSLNNLSPDALDLVTIDEEEYAVPWMAFDARAVYYNKDLIQKLDLSIPTNFEEFETMLADIKAAGYVPISLSGLSSWQLLWIYEETLSAMYPEYCAGFTDYTIDATGEEARHALNKILEWADKGYFGDGFEGVDEDGQSLAFTTEQAVMTVDGSWKVSTFQSNNPNLNFGAFQLPTKDGKRGMMGSFANGFSMNAETDNKAAATAFLEFCTSEEAQKIWIQSQNGVSGYESIPSSTGIAEEISDVDQVFSTWQSMLTKHSSTDISAASIWEEDSPNIFSGRISVDDLMDEIGQAMD